MKKFFSLVLSCLLLLSALALPTSAALTEAQKETLVAYTEKFLEDGNAAGLLQYGSVNNHLGHNLFTVRCETKGNLQIPNTATVTFPGDYLVLDCSAFFALMYKAVFGIRLDYVYSGMYTGGHHASNWNTAFFFDEFDEKMAESEDPLKVYNLKGEVVDLFETVLYLKGSTDNRYTTVDLLSCLDQMEVGDPIIGYNRDTGWGHYMFYAGDGYLYHSTSTHQVVNGKYLPYTMRKQKLEDIVSVGYTDLKVLRLADHILEPDFAGYNVPVDFKKLTTDDSLFDTKSPYFERIDIKKNGSNYVVDVRVSDEYGELTPLAFADNPDVLYKSSGYGESGVLGVALTQSATAPAIYYDYHPSSNPNATTYAFIANEHQNRAFTRLQNAKQMYNELGWEDMANNVKKHYGYGISFSTGECVKTPYYYQPQKDIGTLLTDGTYYLHAKDAAENVARPILLLLNSKASYAFQGTGELLARYVMDPTAYPLSASDVTADGKIDDKDFTVALRHVTGEKRLFSDLAVDADGDGDADVMDLLTILKNKGKTPEIAAASKPMVVDVE